MKMPPLMWDREELGEELRMICLHMELKDQMARWALNFPAIIALGRKVLIRLIAIG